MGLLERWPVVRQLKHRDLTGLLIDTAGRAQPTADGKPAPRTRDADGVTRSVCPYCAVGCGQLLYTRDGALIDIEGDPESPVSRGKLCPKGAATYQLVTGTHRPETVLYRRPGGDDWEPVELEWAEQRVAELMKQTRDRTFEVERPDGTRVNRTLGFAHLGGATLDNEENYLIKKLFTAMGAIQIENQARI